MFKRRHVLLIAAIAASAAWAAPSLDALPDSARGTFVQRKTLADVDVTLVSSGAFRFEKGRFFELQTLKPVVTAFTATPTNYTMTVRGKSTTRPLGMDVSSFEKIFAIREVAEFVRKVEVEPEDAFPTRVRVLFKNGDVLEMLFTRDCGQDR